jgi:hypothetical protein
VTEQQAADLLLLAQQQYQQDTELNSRLVAVYTMQQVHAVELLAVLVVVVVVGLAICGLLRPRL